MTDTEDLHARLIAAEARAIVYELALKDVHDLLVRQKPHSAEDRAREALRKGHSHAFSDPRKDVPNAHHA